MFSNNYSVRKYIVSTALVTTIALTPIFSESVFANAGPDTETNKNNAPVTEQVENDETITIKTGIVSMNDHGGTVRDIQEELNHQGYTTNSDGIFGEETDKSVRDFQSDKNIAVDGKVGPVTIEALSINSPNDDENLTITDTPEQQTSTSKSNIVATAHSLVGTPYTFGGTTPTAFDSSGFVNYVFAQEGVDLNRTHAAMWQNDGVEVDSPSIGDVVFFENTYKTGVSHSGIYIGDNQMIHAGTEKTGVEITDMVYDYWQDHYIGAKSFN